MTTIQMLKELIVNGGKFETDANKYWYVTIYTSGKIIWRSKTNHQEDEVVELSEGFMKYAWKPYVKPVDWSKIQIDTKVICVGGGRKYKRHFAGIHDGKPCVWNCGQTSWSDDGNVDYAWLWDEIKLAE